MKKQLLLLSALTLSAGMSMAFGPTEKLFLGDSDFIRSGSVDKTVTMKKSPMKADASTPYLNYTKAEEMSSAYALGGIETYPCYVYVAFEMSVADQAPYIGCEITAVNVPTGTAYGNPAGNIPSNCARVFAFVTNDLFTRPANATLQTISTVPFTENRIVLDTPYKITGEEPLYVGYYFSMGTNCAFLVTDDIPVSGEYNTLVGLAEKLSDVPLFRSYADQVGSACISCSISGNNLPMNNVSAKSITLPSNVVPGSDFSYNLKIKNNGANEVSDVTIKTQYSDIVKETLITLPSALGISQTAEITVTDIPCPTNGSFNLTSTVIKANGVDIENPVGVTGPFVSLKDGYPRRAVIEEITGTWCGWCPRGIVMMEYLKQYIPDWIRIAVHYGDNMMVNGYGNTLGYAYAGGSAPYAIANRQIEVPVAGSVGSYYTPIYNEITGDNTYCKIDLEATADKTTHTCDIKATATFSIDTDVPHMMSFVLVEDNVGPYPQTNYYAGGSAGAMGGWQNKPSSANTMFDDVARVCFAYPGIPNSIPQNVTAGEYEYTTQMSTRIINANQFRVVGMIVDANTGIIINANEIPVVFSQGGQDGVEDIITDNAAAEKRYFNLQGVEIANPEKGEIVIVKEGNKVSKVIF